MASANLKHLLECRSRVCPHVSMTPTEDQYRGALLGLALGDALGAPHEGGPLERLLWRFLGSTSEGLQRFTDDTQMAVDLSRSLITHGKVEQDDLAIRFSRSYRWSRGYGPGVSRILKRFRSGQPWREASRSVYAAGSFGNGGAMRSPVVGLYYHSRPGELASAARSAAEVTHAHPLGMEGAVLIARATAAALDDPGPRTLFDQAARVSTSAEFTTRIDRARTWLEAGEYVSAKDVRSTLGMGITAPLSCVTALYLASRFADAPFEELLAFAAAAGGDVDTVGAMAGAIWGARNGCSKLPRQLVARVEDAPMIGALAAELFATSLTQPGGTG